MSMKLYGCPNTRSVRVAWTLEEAGVPYAYQRVELASGGGRTAQFLALNPGGKVPVLEHDGAVMTESAAICLWLAARFPDAELAPPPGSEAHARCLRWLLFAATELEQPLWTVARHKFVLPPARRVPAVVETARWEFGMAAQVLEKGLAGREFLAGDAFSVADIVTAHTLSWAMKAAPDHVPPALNAYLQPLLARPALARARAREAA